MLLGEQLYNPSSALERVLSAPAPKQRPAPSAPPLTPTGRLGNGEVARAVFKVLAASSVPMRGTDVHRAVEHLLGHPVSKNSVGWCLAADTRRTGQRRFERVSYGRYRLYVSGRG